jgi:hypothetical protein
VASAPAVVSEADTREQIIDKFLGTNGPAVLVTNPASTSGSISLYSTCHNAIYLDRTYECALFLQSIDRIYHLGLRKGQRVEVNILAEQEGRQRTIDDVDVSLSTKQAAMQQLPEGAGIAPLSSQDSVKGFPLEAPRYRL